VIADVVLDDLLPIPIIVATESKKLVAVRQHVRDKPRVVKKLVACSAIFFIGEVKFGRIGICKLRVLKGLEKVVAAERFCRGLVRVRTRGSDLVPCII
jgi:tRNA(Ile2) C34 agmatinyltransferase TiaS